MVITLIIVYLVQLFNHCDHSNYTNNSIELFNQRDNDNYTYGIEPLNHCDNDNYTNNSLEPFNHCDNKNYTNNSTELFNQENTGVPEDNRFLSDQIMYDTSSEGKRNNNSSEASF